MSTAVIILSVLMCLLALNMLLAKNPITAALSLLGILVMSAGIYGLIGEHMVATIQLVVYAGAIMVLFIFCIMLLNLSEADKTEKPKPAVVAIGAALGLVIFGFFGFALNEHFTKHSQEYAVGSFTPEAVAQLGGNAKVISHSLFSQFYVSFEVISLALLVAVVAAVVLAKRKFD